MARIKGITVTLISRDQVDTDPFGKPIFADVETLIYNVLVSPTSSTDVLNTQSLTGRTAIYTLAIPKTDTNTWEDREVLFFGKRWRVFGVPLEGIESMIPLDWNKKVTVERYE